MSRLDRVLNESGVYRAYDRATRRFDPKSIEYDINDYSKRHRHSTFIQVGANDGVTWDPFYYFIRRDGWRGVVIEPQRDVFERKLKSTYKNADGITLMNVAVDTVAGSRPLYRYAFSSSRWATGMASFDRDRLITNFDSDYIRDNIARERSSVTDDPDSYLIADVVSCITFDTIIDSLSSPSIDFVITDVEGHDVAILDTFPLHRVRPANIVFELPIHRDAPLDRFAAKLREHGYRMKVAGRDAIAMLRGQAAR